MEKTNTNIFRYPSQSTDVTSQSQSNLFLAKKSSGSVVSNFNENGLKETETFPNRQNQEGISTKQKNDLNENIDEEEYEEFEEEDEPKGLNGKKSEKILGSYENSLIKRFRNGVFIHDVNLLHDQIEEAKNEGEGEEAIRQLNYLEKEMFQIKNVDAPDLKKNGNSFRKKYQTNKNVKRFDDELITTFFKSNSSNLSNKNIKNVNNSSNNSKRSKKDKRFHQSEIIVNKYRNEIEEEGGGGNQKKKNNRHSEDNENNKNQDDQNEVIIKIKHINENINIKNGRSNKRYKTSVIKEENENEENDNDNNNDQPNKQINRYYSTSFINNNLSANNNKRKKKKKKRRDSDSSSSSSSSSSYNNNNQVIIRNYKNYYYSTKNVANYGETFKNKYKKNFQDGDENEKVIENIPNNINHRVNTEDNNVHKMKRNLNDNNELPERMSLRSRVHNYGTTRKVNKYTHAPEEELYKSSNSRPLKRRKTFDIQEQTRERPRKRFQINDGDTVSKVRRIHSSNIISSFESEKPRRRKSNFKIITYDEEPKYLKRKSHAIEMNKPFDIVNEEDEFQRPPDNNQTSSEEESKIDTFNNNPNNNNINNKANNNNDYINIKKVELSDMDKIRLEKDKRIKKNKFTITTVENAPKEIINNKNKNNITKPRDNPPTGEYGNVSFAPSMPQVLSSDPANPNRNNHLRRPKTTSTKKPFPFSQKNPEPTGPKPFTQLKRTQALRPSVPQKRDSTPKIPNQFIGQGDRANPIRVQKKDSIKPKEIKAFQPKSKVYNYIHNVKKTDDDDEDEPISFRKKNKINPQERRFQYTSSSNSYRRPVALVNPQNVKLKAKLHKEKPVSNNIHKIETEEKTIYYKSMFEEAPKRQKKYEVKQRPSRSTCFACDHRCGISVTGYSTMKFSPYKNRDGSNRKEKRRNFTPLGIDIIYEQYTRHKKNMANFGYYDPPEDFYFDNNNKNNGDKDNYDNYNESQ